MKKQSRNGEVARDLAFSGRTDLLLNADNSDLRREMHRLEASLIICLRKLEIYERRGRMEAYMNKASVNKLPQSSSNNKKHLDVVFDVESTSKTGFSTSKAAFSTSKTLFSMSKTEFSTSKAIFSTPITGFRYRKRCLRDRKRPPIFLFT